MKRLCCFFNYNPIYRYPIYRAMDEELECDFYFGDSVFEPLKQFAPNTLKGFRVMLHAVSTKVSVFVWHQGISKLFIGYSDYLVTGQHDYLSNWLLILFAKLTGRHIYCWSHGASESSLKGFKSRMLNKYFFRCMDGIFLYGSYHIPAMKKIGIKEKKMHIIHNSLDTYVQTELYRQGLQSNIYQQHFGNSHPTIIYIGRIQTRKKLNLLIEALEILNHQTPIVNLVIVGAPTDDHTIESMVTKRGQNDYVWFYGPCFDEQKNAELLYNAAVCVCPAAVGLTAIHALSYGTPVVSNDDFEHQMPEFEAIIDQQTGSFYQTENVQSLATEILRWIQKTPAERQTIRDIARQTIEASWSINYQISLLRAAFPQYIHTSSN